MILTGKPKRHNQRWDDETDALLRGLADGGTFLPAIARELGRSQEACRTRANLLGISVRSSAGPRRVGFHGER